MYVTKKWRIITQSCQSPLCFESRQECFLHGGPYEADVTRCDTQNASRCSLRGVGNTIFGALFWYDYVTFVYFSCGFSIEITFTQRHPTAPNCNPPKRHFFVSNYSSMNYCSVKSLYTSTLQRAFFGIRIHINVVVYCLVVQSIRHII